MELFQYAVLISIIAAYSEISGKAALIKYGKGKSFRKSELPILRENSTLSRYAATAGGSGSEIHLAGVQKNGSGRKWRVQGFCDLFDRLLGNHGQGQIVYDMYL